MGVNFTEYRQEYFEKLHDAFLDAFSKYFVSFRPGKEQFYRRIHSKLNILPELSGLAMNEDHVESFVLHTFNTYQNKKTIYNGGTGTRINSQGEGLAHRLYEYLFPKLKTTGAERILLEVVDKNLRAQKLYEGLNFKFTRVLKCYKLTSPIDSLIKEIEIEVGEWDESLNANLSFEPCFMDSSNQLPYNLENERVLIAKGSGQTIGHLVFQPDLGRISQLAVHPDQRGKGIGKELVSACQHQTQATELTILNIPESELETTDTLEKMGFVNEIDQFELELII